MAFSRFLETSNPISRFLPREHLVHLLERLSALDIRDSLTIYIRKRGLGPQSQGGLSKPVLLFSAHHGGAGAATGERRAAGSWEMRTRTVQRCSVVAPTGAKATVSSVKAVRTLVRLKEPVPSLLSWEGHGSPA